MSITGTPTAAGTETFTVTATDSLGATTSATYSVTVNLPVTLSPLMLPTTRQTCPTAKRSRPAAGTGNKTLTVSNIQNAIAELDRAG